MNKKQLVAKIAQKTSFTKLQCEKTLDAMLDIIQRSVAKGDDVKLIGFGTFSYMVKKPRKGRNPKTGIPVEIPELKAPRFKAGKDFKEYLK